MKLYNVSTSNFAAKSRIAIYEKGLAIDIVPIPGNDLKSPEYLKINFLGKTPALDADGLMIPESETINEYLEDKFPAPPLLPKSPEGRARVRILTRFHDLYLTSTQEALASQLNPQNRNEKLLNEKLAEQNLRLDQLDDDAARKRLRCRKRLYPCRLRTGADNIFRSHDASDTRRRVSTGRASKSRIVVDSRADSSVGPASDWAK